MSEVKSAKDALVASLFELSRAAQDAAAATATLYKVSQNDATAPVDTLSSLSKAITTLVSNVDGPAIADKKKTKQKAEEKDPNAPKKPITIYFAYSFHIRDQIREERKAQGLPPLSAIEMNDYVKDRWSKLTDADKAPWKNKYQEELKEYNKQKELYTKAKAAGETPPVPVLSPVVELPKKVIAPVESSSDSSSDSSSSDSEVEKREKKKKEKKRKHDKEKSEKKKKSKK